MNWTDLLEDEPKRELSERGGKEILADKISARSDGNSENSSYYTNYFYKIL